MYWS
jgi:hypothetical protein